MDDDWESENFVPAAPNVGKEKPKGLWDDEDAEEEEVKESWEDDDKPAPAPEPKPVSTTTAAKPERNKANGSKGRNTKIEEKKVVETNKLKPGKSPDEKLDPLAEKLRQQRLVEEADYQSTTDLFGKPSGQKSLDNFIPKSEADFLEYAELIAQHMRPFEKSFHYITLLKAVIRHGMACLKAADAKDVSSTATVIANEKIKSEKESAAGKKKAGSKKKQIHVDREEDDPYVGVYDDAVDYDFM
eukprot:TRINITY_DN810_c0_g3_i1.p1 TRINITY_DN810_c0_g3~~TRINITY_DN810_c0_g3_i1.p1  ORF type:complete len:243 (+),score=78.24 TRINITY_DN810_c0_g3_i1:440-1168(+)